MIFKKRRNVIMKNYRENLIYKRNKGLIVSVIRKKSPINKVIKTLKTELENDELTKMDVNNMFGEVYIENVKPFRYLRTNTI
jgi:hypothetical protein